MPFDFEEYQSKCSTLSPEELQREWENYTRHIAGGATSTAGSVLFAPLTAGASLVGLGLSTPRIHNARKKRAIIETRLQAHGTTPHTRKRDVVAPMAVAGAIGGLTLGFAGPGADLLGRQAAEKGVEYFVSHAALEAAVVAMEHKHDQEKKMEVQDELAQKYENVDGPGSDQETTLLSPRASIRKSKSDTCLDGLAYGSLPGEKRPKKPKQRQQASQPDSITVPVQMKLEDSPATELSSPLKPGSATQSPQKEDQNPNEPSESGMKLPYLGLPDHDEAEQRGYVWDPTRGMYMRSESLDYQRTEESLSSPPISHADTKSAENQSDELEDLLSQLLVENSTASGDTSATQTPQVSLGSAGKEPLPLQTSNPVLVPDKKSSSLPPRPQSFALSPRPQSSIQSYAMPAYQPARPELHSYIPPPPPQQPNQQQVTLISSQPQYNPQQHYNPQQYLPPPPPSKFPARFSYQPSRVQFPHQYYPPPPPSPSQIPLPPPPARRPGPQPFQHQPSQAHTEQRQDSNSSVATVSSASTSTFSSLDSASTVSAAETPLTGSSTSKRTLTPASSYSYDPAIYDVSPKTAAAKLCTSPKPSATTMYFPPPPTGVVAGSAGKEKGRDHFG
jgi:hypothetical protein